MKQRFKQYYKKSVFSILMPYKYIETNFCTDCELRFASHFCRKKYVSEWL